jgi:hypothetical protein
LIKARIDASGFTQVSVITDARLTPAAQTCLRREPYFCASRIFG